MAKTSESQTCRKPLPAKPRPVVEIHDDQSDLEIDFERIKRLVYSSLRKLDIDCDELAIYFVSKEMICSLHEMHFNDPSPTDCITLPMDAPGERSGGRCFLGEAFICPNVAISQAKEHDTTPHDEAMRYVVHCILHMAGYKDATDAGRAEMRELEDALLTTGSQNR